MKNVTLSSGKVIGKGQPCYIIAEIGINHNGSLDVAKQLVDEGANAKADAVSSKKELQNYVFHLINGKSKEILLGEECRTSTTNAKQNLVI